MFGVLFLSTTLITSFVTLPSYSSSISTFDDNSCEWRFDNCSRAPDDFRCVLWLRSWCRCEQNASCATNSTLEVNITAARSLLGALNGLCDLVSCTVVPQRCEWAPWDTYFSTCMLTLRRRTRPRCCHPVNRTPMNEAFYVFRSQNISCAGTQSQRQTNMGTSNDCYSPPKPQKPKIRKPDNDFPSAQFIVAAILGFLFLSLSLCACLARKKRSPPPTVQHREQPSRPTTIVIPQPGWPLNEVQPLTK